MAGILSDGELWTILLARTSHAVATKCGMTNRRKIKTAYLVHDSLRSLQGYDWPRPRSHDGHEEGSRVADNIVESKCIVSERNTYRLNKVPRSLCICRNNIGGNYPACRVIDTFSVNFKGKQGQCEDA
jgi:hypothetical protein